MGRRWDPAIPKLDRRRELEAAGIEVRIETIPVGGSGFGVAGADLPEKVSEEESD